MTQAIWFSFPLFQRPCPFLSGLDFLKAGRELILQMEHSVFSPLLFFIYLVSYALPPGRKGNGIAISGSSNLLMSYFLYTILITGWSEVIFVLGEGLVWRHNVFQKHFIPSQVLWFPGERTVLVAGLAWFAYMCILIISFLMMSGLSLIFKLFPEEELILEADKGDRMGAGSQSPNPASFCMATHLYLLNIEYL